MGYYDRRFVRPSIHDLVAALDEATRAANEPHQRLAFDEEHWPGVVSDIRTQPEGVQQWRGDDKHGATAVVGLAWWTDAQSRRHFRVWASSSDDEHFTAHLRYLLFGGDRQRPAWAPVWHIAPDFVVKRTHEGSRDYLVGCACGTCGAPEALGWTGDCCGKCHLSRPTTHGEDVVAVFAQMHGRVDDLIFSPDSRYLAATGDGRIVRLWDVTAREPCAPLYPPHPEIKALTFAPGSRLLAIAGGDRILRFFDLKRRQEELTLPTPSLLHLVAIAPDDLTLVMAGEKETEIWGRAEWDQPWQPLRCESQPAQAVCYSPSCDEVVLTWPDSVSCWRLRPRGGLPVALWWRYYERVTFTRVAWCAARQSLSLFTASSKRGPTLYRDSLNDRNQFGVRDTWKVVACPRLSPDGFWFAGLDGTAVVVDHVENGAGKCRLEFGPHPALTALAFSPNGHTLAVADMDGTIRLWPWRRLVPGADQKPAASASAPVKQTEEPVQTEATKTTSAESSWWEYAISRTCGSEQKWLTLGPQAQPPAVVFRISTTAINHLALSSTGLVAAASQGVIFVWSVQTRSAVVPFVAGQSAVQTLTFSPDGFHLLVATGNQTLRVFNARTSKQVQSLSVPPDVRQVTVSPDDRTLVVLGAGATQLWHRTDTEGPWRMLRCDSTSVPSACFTPSGHELILARDRELECWSLVKDNQGPTVQWVQHALRHSYEAIRFAGQRGYLCALVCDDGRRSVRLYDRAGGGPHAARELKEQFFSPCFSPDGEWLAGLDGFYVVLEPIERHAQGCRLEPAARHPLTALAFSPDGGTLALAGQDGTVRLWPWQCLLDG
jgi:WD40 repeat protein